MARQGSVLPCALRARHRDGRVGDSPDPGEDPKGPECPYIGDLYTYIYICAKYRNTTHIYIYTHIHIHVTYLRKHIYLLTVYM